MKTKNEIWSHTYNPRFVWNWPVLKGSKHARVMFGSNVMLKFVCTNFYFADTIMNFNHN